MNPSELLNPELQKLVDNGVAAAERDYHGTNALLYDKIQGDIGDIDFFLKLVGSTPCKILELGSGTGRITIPLARAGHKVFALDSSSDMHDILSQKTPPELQASIVHIHSDMTDIPVDETFDMAILPLNTVHHLTDPSSRERCFRSVNEHLPPEALFVIDLVVPTGDLVANTEGNYQLRMLDMDGSTSYVWIMYSQYNPKSQLNVLNFLTIRTEKNRGTDITVTPAAEYYPSAGEMRLLLESAGFRIRSMYGNYDCAPFEDSPGRTMIVVAQAAP